MYHCVRACVYVYVNTYVCSSYIHIYIYVILTNICVAQNRLCSALSTASSVNGPGRWIRSPPPPLPQSTVDPPPPVVNPAAAAAAGPCDGRRCAWLFDSVFCCCCVAAAAADVPFWHLLVAAPWPPFCDSSLPLNSLSATNAGFLLRLLHAPPHISPYRPCDPPPPRGTRRC